jgi:hypothetical protein
LVRYRAVCERTLIVLVIRVCAEGEHVFVARIRHVLLPIGKVVVQYLSGIDMAGLAERRRGKGRRRGSTCDGTEHGVAHATCIENVLRLHRVREVGWAVRSEAVAGVVASDVHAITIEVHLALVLQGLRSRHGGMEGGAGRRVVIGGVERGGHGGAVEEVGVRGILRHERRSNGREAKLLLKRAGGAYDGVLGHLEVGGVDVEGHMGLRSIERGWLQRRLVERVVVEGSFVVGNARNHGTVDGRHLGRSFGASLGRLIRHRLAWRSRGVA